MWRVLYNNWMHLSLSFCFLQHNLIYNKECIITINKGNKDINNGILNGAGRKSGCATNADGRLTDLQTCRIGGLKTCRLADLQTCRLSDLQTCRIADLQNWRFEDLQACRPADLQAFRLSGFQTCRLGGLKTC